MNCFSPIAIQKDGMRTIVPCGKCYACRINLRMQWTYRLHRELLVSHSAYFVSLSYADKYVPEMVDRDTGEICKVLRKTDLQSFIKRLRHYSKFRYFAVGEYGENTNRPHYHLLIFNLSWAAARKIESTWSMGNILIGRVETASIHYCTKDMMKDKTKNAIAGVEGFRLMSTRPPIGVNEDIINSMLNNKLDNDFTVSMNGFKQAMPRYYKERIFSIKERDNHANEMIKLADNHFWEWMRTCKRRGINNVFTYIEKERQAAIRQENKLLKMRKL